MALNLSKTVINYLTARPEEKFTARQIAEWVFATFPEECQAKKSNSKTYYSEKSDSDEVAMVESVAPSPVENTGQSNTNEHALYPLLSRYLREEFNLYSRRINEKRSSNKRGPNGNRWLYPDVVGMEDLGVDWHRLHQTGRGQSRRQPSLDPRARTR